MDEWKDFSIVKGNVELECAIATNTIDDEPDMMFRLIPTALDYQWTLPSNYYKDEKNANDYECIKKVLIEEWGLLSQYIKDNKAIRINDCEIRF